MATQFFHTAQMVKLRETEGLPPKVLDYKLSCGAGIDSERTLIFDVDESTFGCLFLLLNTPAAKSVAFTKLIGSNDHDIWVLQPETCYQLDDFYGFDVKGPEDMVVHIEVHCDPEKEKINN